MKNALNILQNVLWQVMHTKSGKLETADIARIVLWNNKLVCINSKSVYNNRLVNKGILIRTRDLIAENNELITKCKLRELNVSPLDVFQLASVMDALSVAWRQSLKACECSGTVSFNLQEQTQLLPNGKKVLLSKAESKIIYKELRNRVIIQPIAQRKYIAKFENDNLNWKTIYSLPFRVTLDTKLRECQCKLLNRCIASNAFVCKIGILSSWSFYQHGHLIFWRNR